MVLARAAALALVALAVLLTACGEDELERTQSTAPGRAIEYLAADLDVPLDEITLVTIETKQWPDACLGLGESGEVCAQVITPGFVAILEHAGQRYTYRTDATGEVVRRAAGPEPAPTGAVTATVPAAE